MNNHAVSRAVFDRSGRPAFKGSVPKKYNFLSYAFSVQTAEFT